MYFIIIPCTEPTYSGARVIAKSHFTRNLLLIGELVISGTELTLNVRLEAEINH